MVSNTMDFLSNRTQTEIILFCVYIVVMLSAFLFIWIPYMRRINLKIWRTKGMLNMIPMEVINKHESLKNAFISGDILSAVKWEKEQIVLEEQHERTQDYSEQILLSNGLNFIWLYLIPTFWEQFLTFSIGLFHICCVSCIPSARR